jgi:hypothetical protein
MALATLSIDLVAKLADLEQGFARAAALADKTATRMEMSFSGLTSKAIELGKAIGGIWAAKQFVGFINDVNEGVAALEDLSAATGSSVENLSALEDVGRRTGNTFETVATTLVKFNKQLNDAKAGDETTRIFEALGLSVKELKALDPAEALRRTAVALEGFTTEGDKARAVQVLFGRSIRDAAPFIRDLAEQTKLVGTVTADAAKAAKAFDDALAGLSKDLLDAARAIIGPLVDNLNVLIAKFKEARDASRAWAKEGREKDAADSRAQELRIVNDMIAANTKLLDAGNLSLERKTRLLNQQRGLMAQQANLEAGMEGGASPFAALGQVVTTPTGKASLKVAGEAEKQTEIQKLVERYRELFEAELRVNDIDKELAKAKSLLADPKFANATAAERQAVLDYADGLDKLRAAFEQASNEATRFRLAEVRDTEKVNEALRQSKVAQMEEMSQLFRAGQGDPSAAAIRREVDLRKYLDEIGASAANAKAAIEALHGTGDPALQKLSDMDMAVQDLGKSLDDTLGQGLEAMLTGHFDNIGKLFQRMLEQMAVKALQANLMDSLFGAMGAGGNRAGGGWVSAFMSAVGWGGGKASGGLVAPWSLTQVNDQAGAPGVEGFSTGGKDFLLTGSQGGRVNKAGSGGGAAVVQVNIAAGVSRNEVAALIPALKSQIKAEVIAAMRRPGFSGG